MRQIIHQRDAMEQEATGEIAVIELNMDCTEGWSPDGTHFTAQGEVFVEDGDEFNIWTRQ